MELIRFRLDRFSSVNLDDFFKLNSILQCVERSHRPEQEEDGNGGWMNEIKRPRGSFISCHARLALSCVWSWLLCYFFLKSRILWTHSRIVWINRRDTTRLNIHDPKMMMMMMAVAWMRYFNLIIGKSLRRVWEITRNSTIIRREIEFSARGKFERKVA